jgi:hypothetical protein
LPQDFPALRATLLQRHPPRHALHGQRPRDRACAFAPTLSPCSSCCALAEEYNVREVPCCCPTSRIMLQRTFAAEQFTPLDSRHTARQSRRPAALPHRHPRAGREQGSTRRRTKALASTFAALAGENDARLAAARTLPAAGAASRLTALLTLVSIFCFRSLRRSKTEIYKNTD